MLCEDGGYTCCFWLHTWKDTLVEGNRNLTISEKIVLDLMLPLLHNRYHLYIDNWYTSITLLQYLRENDTLACGTICKNWKGFPDAVLWRPDVNIWVSGIFWSGKSCNVCAGTFYCHAMEQFRTFHWMTQCYINRSSKWCNYGVIQYK